MPAPAPPRKAPKRRANPLPDDFVCPGEEELEALRNEREQLIDARRDMNPQQKEWDPNLQRLLDITLILQTCGGI